MTGWLRDNGLSLALAVLFFASLFGMVFSGWSAENQTGHEHGQAIVALADYLASGEFLSLHGKRGERVPSDRAVSGAGDLAAGAWLT